MPLEINWTLCEYRFCFQRIDLAWKRNITIRFCFGFLIWPEYFSDISCWNPNMSCCWRPEVLCSKAALKGAEGKTLVEVCMNLTWGWFIDRRSHLCVCWCRELQHDLRSIQPEMYNPGQLRSVIWSWVVLQYTECFFCCFFLKMPVCAALITGCIHDAKIQ